MCDMLEKFEVERRINMDNGTIKVYIKAMNAVGGTQCRVKMFMSAKNWTYSVQLFGSEFPCHWASAIEQYLIEWVHTYVGPTNRVPQLAHTLRG